MSRITERDRRAVLSFQREIYRLSDFDAFIGNLFPALYADPYARKLFWKDAERNRALLDRTD